ncbi:MAG: hypothetical protein ACXVCP_04275 [Bdellovibrio sp.]
MNKILLVYEDYADLMAVEASLKKAGFDVIGLSTEYSIAEQMLAFNPDIVVGSGKGGRVSSLGVGKRLKEMSRWQGKSILIFPANFKPNPQELIRIRVDMILESPVLLPRLVQVIGRMLGHDETVLLEKINKAGPVDVSSKSPGSSGKGHFKLSPENEAIYVQGSTDQAPDEEEDVLKKNETKESVRAEKEFQFEDANPEGQRGKFPFVFGDRISAGTSENEKSASGENGEAFPDVDLKALERELTGGGAPEVEKSEPIADELSSVRTEEDELHLKAQEELHNVESGLKGRIAKYSKMVADVKISPESTVSRVEARRRQKGLQEDLDKKNLRELDNLRQQFAKALFKK